MQRLVGETCTRGRLPNKRPADDWQDIETADAPVLKHLEESDRDACTEVAWKVLNMITGRESGSVPHNR